MDHCDPGVLSGRREQKKRPAFIKSAPACSLRQSCVTHPRHDAGSTTARSVDEIALIRDTINHYGPVFIASLSIQIRRAGVQKKPLPQPARSFPLSTGRPEFQVYRDLVNPASHRRRKKNRPRPRTPARRILCDQHRRTAATVSRISATSSTDRAVVDPVSCRLGA